MQARARLDLREMATKDDAEDVVDIMKNRWCCSSQLVSNADWFCFHRLFHPLSKLEDKHVLVWEKYLVFTLTFSLLCSLADTYSDGLGNLDFRRSQHGSGMSQRSAAKRLVSALHLQAQKNGQREFDLQTLRSIADRLNIKVMYRREREKHHVMFTSINK